MGSELTEIIFLTLQCAFVSATLVFIPGIPLAYCLSRFSFKGKTFLLSLISLPLVLPPTAVGYLMLDLLARESVLGSFLEGIGVEVILTPKAIIIAGATMSLPLVVRTAKVAFDGVSPQLEKMAWTLGYSPVKTFLKVTIPLAGKGLMAAFILGFTRSMGEFGATVVLAGNIPGETRTISSAIFVAQQTGQSDKAYFLIGVASLVGFIAILTSELLSK